MTVVFDLLGFQNRDHGERGIARYVLNLAKALEQHHPGFVDEYRIDPTLPLPTGAEALVQTGKVVRADTPPPKLTANGPNAFICGSLVELDSPLDAVLPRWARTPAWQRAVVLYDLIPLRYPDWYLSNAGVRSSYEARIGAYKAFDQLLSISHASASDAEDLLGVRKHQVTVIGAGADKRFQPPSATRGELVGTLRHAVAGLRSNYVLFPTGIDPRKNVEPTIRAYAQLPAHLREVHQLVVVCRLTPQDRGRLHELADSLHVADDVLLTGFVDDQQLVSLYQAADLVIFPSLYEGFGLPVLEAMQCGAPVICSDSSSLREVQTDASRRFDPTSEAAITESLVTALTADAGRESPDVPDFTWERAANLTVSALEQHRARSPRTPRRPTLAIVTPLPPQASGIATYAERMINELRSDFQISAFVDFDQGPTEEIEDVQILDIDHLDALVAGGGAFDHVLYFIGNSSFHVKALDALEKNPGVVFLHDARLTGLYSEVHRLQSDRLLGASVGATLESMYPNRYRREVVEMPVITPDISDRFGILMAAELVAAATSLLVHSEYAASLIELDTGTRPQVAFEIPCPTSSPRDEPFRPIISSFGIVAPSKQPDKLIEALPFVAKQVPDVELRFVGGVDPRYRRLLEASAEQLGVAHRVEFTGHLSDDEFAAEQRSTGVAVQLRGLTNGESSAAVSEMLALGIPTIVSRLGPMSEIPHGVVIHHDNDHEPAELANELLSVLTDSARRNELATAAKSHAEANSFTNAARVLGEILRNVR